MGQESWYRRDRAAIPSVSVNASPGGCVFISDEWWPVVSGLLELGLLDSFWDANTGDVAKGVDGILQLATATGECGNMEFAIFEERQQMGTHAGGSIAGTQWRQLNTEIYNDGFVSLANNVLTVEPGKYLVEASAPAFRCGAHRCFLSNQWNTYRFAAGTSETNYNDSIDSREQTRSFIQDVFSIGSQQLMQIWHYTFAAKPTNGLGVASGQFVDEIYSKIKLTRLGDF